MECKAHGDSGKMDGRFLLLLLGTGALAAALFLPKYAAFFTRDDFVMMDLAMQRGISDLFTTSLNGYFVPGVKAYFLVMVSLFGKNPVAWNTMGVVIHVVNIVLVGWFILRLARNRLAAVTGAAVFGLSYPAYEAVSWIASIAWALEVSMFIISTMAYLLFRGWKPAGAGDAVPAAEPAEEDAWAWRTRPGMYALSFIVAVVAILTKEGAVMLPVVILVAELLLVQRAFEPWHWRRAVSAVKWVLPFLAVSVAFGVTQMFVQSSGPMMGTGKWGLGTHIFSNLARYLDWFFLIPPQPFSGGGFLSHGVGGALLASLQVFGFIVIPALLMIALARGNMVERFAVLWIIVTIFPLLMFTAEPSSRYLYVPGVGFALLFGELFAVRLRGLLVRKEKRGWFAVCAVVVALFIAVSACGMFLGARRFARRCEPNRNIARQLESMDREFPPGTKLKITGVPEIVLDQNAVVAIVNMYAPGLEPSQFVPDDEPGLVVYAYTEPDGRLAEVR